MKFEGIMLSVKDAEASKKLYQELFKLELDLDWEFNPVFKGGIILRQGFADILKIPIESVVNKSHSIELVFETNQFDDFVIKAKNYPGVQFVNKGVIEQPWGQRVLHIYDLDGHIIEVGENFGEVVKRFKESGMSNDEISNRCGMPLEDVQRIIDGDY